MTGPPWQWTVTVRDGKFHAIPADPTSAHDAATHWDRVPWEHRMLRRSPDGRGAWAREYIPRHLLEDAQAWRHYKPIVLDTARRRVLTCWQEGYPGADPGRVRFHIGPVIPDHPRGLLCVVAVAIGVR